MNAALSRAPKISRLGAAISGGGDSTALLLLLSRWSRICDVELLVASVNHGFRTEAVREIDNVRSLAESLGHAHSTLHWRARGESGNFQNSARDARYNLLGNWAAEVGANALALGHTEDDQAETFLLRLARGSGVDGLACMSEATWRNGILWLRPLLGIRRIELREYLEFSGIAWSEDSSNEDRAFDRIKIRSALRELEPAGLSVPRLAATARRMRMAKKALQAAATRSVREICAVNEVGDLTFSGEIWTLEEETRFRILAQAAMFISGNQYRPRFRSLLRTVDEVACGRQATLSGCVFGPSSCGGILVGREPANCEGAVHPGEIWDARWRMERVGGEAYGEVGQLGESGLANCPGWKATGFRKSSLIASPSVWYQGGLASAPLAGIANGWRASMISGKNEFLASLAGH